MTKRQAENYARLSRTMLDGLGIARDDFDTLLRIERTLHRWAERECNGEVEVDDDGKAWHSWHDDLHTGPTVHRVRIPNRERGALKRLSAIMARYPALGAYHQTDPRGCALYVYEASRLYTQRVGCHESTCTCHDITHGEAVDCSSCGCRTSGIDSCYSSIGVAVCV